MNKDILHKEVQSYINKHLGEDVNKLLLSKSPFSNLSTRDLAQQIDSKKRAEKKLPKWFNTPGIFYPPKLNIEQASSEQTAEYKSRLISGRSVIDLTGGFGVDDYFFSKKAEKVTHIERDQDLSEIAGYNADVFGLRNINFIVGDSIEYLKNCDSEYDTIYIDPARRIQSKKLFLLKDTEPDVVSNLPLFLKKAGRILIKTSPLFDIQSGLDELSNVSEVHVVSLKNDCKELIWVIEKGHETDAKIYCTALAVGNEQNFCFFLSAEKEIKLEAFGSPSGFLYEPDVALLKAGAFKSVSLAFNLTKLNNNTHLYTSENLVQGFIGRTFEIQVASSYKQFIKNNKIKKANIISRNFPLSPEEIKKKHKIQDGGEDFLIFCTGPGDELLAIHATKVLAGL